MQIVFMPTVGGPRTGQLTVNDNAPNSPQTLTLTGPGVDFTLTSDGSTTVTTTSGQNAVFPLLVSSAANVSGTVSFTCTGMPANSTCNITPSTVALGGTTTVSVTVLTGVASSSSSASLRRARGSSEARLLWLATLLPMGFACVRRRRITASVLLCLLIATSGCGAGREIPLTSNPSGGGTSTGPATPSGTYTVVTSASSAGLSRAISLTLIVQ
jgi:hypothetical protein